MKKMLGKPGDDCFDFIVVGAGSSGAALAARLSEQKHFRVLLLEAGRRRQEFRYRLPILTSKALSSKAGVWHFETQPEPGLDGRRLAWPRGKGLGGSSLINGMLWVRGDSAEYDHWASQGCDQWAYQDLLPYFQRSEAYIAGSSPLRGRDGAVKVNKQKAKDALSQAFLQSCHATGIKLVEDYNEGWFEGAAYLQFNTHQGLRFGTDRAYLQLAMKRSNLTVRKVTVCRVILDERRAVGVEYLLQGSKYQVRAAKEVILSCGTVQSPQILELSGIGNHAYLERAGISTQVPLPGVGENLRDHLSSRVGVRTRYRGTLNDVQHHPWWKLRAALQWGLRRSGPLSMIGATAHAWAKTNSSLDRPDVKLQLLHYSAAYKKDNISSSLNKEPGFSISNFVLRPKSVGSIHIKSNQVDDSPDIIGNYLSHEDDIVSTIGAYTLAREILQNKAFSSFVKGSQEIDALNSEDKIMDWVRSTGLTSYHPIGTCKMGGDGMSVVDAQLKVKGVHGLRVADASIMPTMPSSNTQAPTTMIGEKAAAMIIADWAH